MPKVHNALVDLCETKQNIEYYDYDDIHMPNLCVWDGITNWQLRDCFFSLILDIRY